MHSAGPVRLDGRALRLRALVKRLPGISRPSRRSSSHPVDEDTARRWIRGFLPVGGNQRTVVTCDSWHSPRLTLEILTDELGGPSAHQHLVREAVRIIDSGDTLVVQVCTTQNQDETPDASTSTTRVWVVDRDGARAVDAELLEQNLTVAEQEERLRAGSRFATGWPLTGEPGGGDPPAAGISLRNVARTLKHPWLRG